MKHKSTKDPSTTKNSESKNDASHPHLTLRIDFHDDCLAGTFVSGCVYLVLPARTPRWQGIHVRLEGYEYATTTVVDSGSLTQTKASPLILIEQPIVVWSARNHPDMQTDSAQHFEFPFRWRLPANLPSTLFCQKDKKSTNNCRIEYQMTAFLISRLGERLISSQAVNMLVRSQALSIKGQPVTVPPKKFSIKTALVFHKGHIEFGIKLSTDIVAPGCTLRVGIYGSNHSQVAVKDFVIRLVERVSWSTKANKSTSTTSNASMLNAPNDHDEDGTIDPDDETRQTVERTLSEERIWTADTTTNWQPKNVSPRYLQEQETLWNILRIPEGSSCSSTFVGEFIRVEHFVVVIAETTADLTTNPRRHYPVCLINANRGDLIVAQQQQQALVLPSDWEPAIAPVMDIPDNLVVPQAQAQVVVPDSAAESRSPMS